MKAGNLKIMYDAGLNVPEFTVIESITDEKIKSLSPECRYSVRSSCSLEDGKSRSFAGQFSTLLNVEYENLEAAVREVFDSMTSYDFAGYSVTESGGMRPRVIIQRQIDSVFSGVCFTANPLGIKNESVIVIGEGTGDNVVEDKTETASYYYNLDDNIYYQSGKKTDISDKLIAEIIETSKRIKKLFGSETDIEFATDAEGRLWILQARPVTTLDGEWKLTLDSSNIAESYPGITLPLSQEFIADVYEGVFRSAVELIVTDKSITDKISFRNMIRFVNGRAYYDIKVFYDIYHLLPFDKIIISIWQNSLGVENKTVTPAGIHISTLQKFRYLFGLKRLFHDNEKNMQALDEYFTGLVDKFRKQIAEASDVYGLQQCYKELRNALCEKWSVTLINDLYAFFFSALVRDKKKISNIKSMESMKPVLMMNELISDPDNEELKRKYIGLYGDRCLGELKLETRTYRTNPELLDEYIKTHEVTEVVREEPSGRSRTAERARTGIYYREQSRMNRSRIYGLVREIYRRTGIMLYESSRLDSPDDIWYLNVSDIFSDEDIKGKAQILRQRYKAFENIPYFTRLIFKDKEFDTSADVTGQGVITDGVMTGTAASSGTEEGDALVIDKPDYTTDTSGKIIIAKSTDPGWVTLIKNARAIVVERGSMLSHTAIITRELGKPSVVNVRNATELIRTGDRVFVNGTTGEVRIVCRSTDA